MAGGIPAPDFKAQRLLNHMLYEIKDLVPLLKAFTNFNHLRGTYETNREQTQRSIKRRATNA